MSKARSNSDSSTTAVMSPIKPTLRDAYSTIAVVSTPDVPILAQTPASSGPPTPDPVFSGKEFMRLMREKYRSRK